MCSLLFWFFFWYSTRRNNSQKIIKCDVVTVAAAAAATPLVNPDHLQCVQKLRNNYEEAVAVNVMCKLVEILKLSVLPSLLR